MDEIMIANFMVFHDLVQDERYDLWIGDEAWEVDYFLHENPEEKPGRLPDWGGPSSALELRRRRAARPHRPGEPPRMGCASSACAAARLGEYRRACAGSV